MTLIAIAKNTYREAVRDKILYLLLVFGILSIMASKVLGYVSIGDEVKIITDISLASISVFGALIAVFVGTTLIYKEVDKRTIYTILSRPIDRREFVLGKYLGLVALLGVTTMSMTLFAAIYILMMGGTVDVMFFEAVILIYWKLLLVTAFSVMLSALTSPILGAVIVLAGYFFGHATGILIDMPPQLEGTSAEFIGRAIYFVTPNLSNFDIWQEYANGVDISQSYVAWTLLYGTVYTGFILYLATLAFENKDV
jgi:ABC-type transport system involved in multi-copper enzyme maturation permease subunit